MNKFNDFYSSIREILNKILQKGCTAINFTIVEAYKQVGWRIIQQEQRLEKIYAVCRQSARSCPFLSVSYSYAEKEPTV